jgi:hypothetical protein
MIYSRSGVLPVDFGVLASDLERILADPVRSSLEEGGHMVVKVAHRLLHPRTTHAPLYFTSRNGPFARKLLRGESCLEEYIPIAAASWSIQQRARLQWLQTLS